MKVIITGGHFSPAFSIIEHIKKKDEVVLAGRKYSFEGDKTLSYEFLTAQKNGIPFVDIPAGRFQRVRTKHTIPSYFKFPKGILKSVQLIRTFQPDIVLSFGGYVSVPVCLAAKTLGIPIVLHEQTTRAGMANRFLAKISTRVCVTFEDSGKNFPKEKTVLTGNPLRKEIFSVKKKIPLPKNKKVIYVTGGSTGSHALNAVIFSSIHELVGKYVVIHQTGDSEQFGDYSKAEQLRSQLHDDLQNKYIVKKFVYSDEIGFILKTADIVISRSGANTVNEILTLGKKCILIPLPQGQANEQLENAKLVERLGFGSIILQKDLDKSHLIKRIEEVTRKKSPSPNTSYSFKAEEKIYSVLKSVYEQGKEKKN